MGRWFRTRQERELDAAVDVVCASLRFATECVRLADAMEDARTPKLAAPVVPSPPYIPEVM